MDTTTYASATLQTHTQSPLTASLKDLLARTRDSRQIDRPSARRRSLYKLLPTISAPHAQQQQADNGSAINHGAAGVASIRPPSIASVATDCSAYAPTDLVTGSVVLGSFCAERHQLYVTLRGAVHTEKKVWGVMANGQYGYVASDANWCFLKHSTAIAVGEQSSTDRQQARFALQIPATLQPHQCPLHDTAHLALPPSLASGRADSRFDLTPPHPSTGARYEIVAEVIDRATRKSLARQAAGFDLRALGLPTSLQSPSADHPARKQLPPHWITAESGEVVSTVFGQKQGTLRLQLGTSTIDAATGLLETILNATFTPAHSSACAASKAVPPPALSGFEASLISCTFTRLTHAHADVRTGRSEQTESAQPFSLCMRAPAAIADTWAAGTVWSRHVGEDGSLSYRARLPLQLQLDGVGDKIALPSSFESCLVSRRYRLRLAITLGTSTVLRKLNKVRYTFAVDVREPADDAQRGVFAATTESIMMVEHDDAEALRPSYEDALATSGCTAPCDAVPSYDFADNARLSQPVAAPPTPTSLAPELTGSAGDQDDAAAREDARREALRTPAWAHKA